MTRRMTAVGVAMGILAASCSAEVPPQGIAPVLEHASLAPSESVQLDGWVVGSTMPTVGGSAPFVKGGFWVSGPHGTTRGLGACVLKDTLGQEPGACTATARADGRGTGPECPTPPTGGYVYCMTADYEGSNRCWTRMGSQSSACSVGVRSGSGSSAFFVTPEAVSDTEVPPFATERWITLTCLNPAGNALACANFPASGGAVYSLSNAFLKEPGGGGGPN